MTRVHRTRRAAIREAIQMVEDLLMSRQRICVQMFQSTSTISVFDVRGGSKVVLHRVRWAEKASK